MPQIVAAALRPLVAQLDPLEAEAKLADNAIGMLQERSGVEYADIDPRDGTGHGLRADGKRVRSIRDYRAAAVRVPLRPCSMPEIIGWQSAARADLQDEQGLNKKTACRGRARSTRPWRAVGRFPSFLSAKVDGYQAAPLVAAAIADKLTRVVFAMMTNGTAYRAARAREQRAKQRQHSIFSGDQEVMRHKRTQCHNPAVLSAQTSAMD